MNKIADLLDRDLSKPIEEFIEIGNDDPDTVFTELTEYVATDRIQGEYERLLAAMAAAAKSPNEDVGVWISGQPGSGKSLFAKNLGCVLANREIHGARASSLFLKQVESQQVAESVAFLNRASPYEVFALDVQACLPLKTDAEQLAQSMYRVLRRDLDHKEDHDLAELEMALEKEGRLSVQELVKRSFDLCEMRRPGKAFAFLLDEVGEYAARGGGRLENLCAVVEQFGKEGLARLKSGKIPGPPWIIVTAQEKLPEVCYRLAHGGNGSPKVDACFRRQIHLSSADIPEVAARRVLRKKKSQEHILRNLFRDQGASLLQNVRLERCSRRTEFSEDQFVQSYPYLPHLIELSVDIMAGIWLQPNAQRYLGGSNRTIVKQSLEMLISDRTRLADQPVGVLVSIDKIYELVEENTPWEKQRDILDIRQRFDQNEDYPGLAARVAKAICLMEFAKSDLPRTTKNIAALLVQRLNEAPPTLAVAAILERLQAAQFVRETEDGWKLYDFDELRRNAADMEWLGKAVGAVNPRAPGLHNDLIQTAKRLLARSLAWYTRPMQEFNASVIQSFAEVVSALDHLSVNMVAFDRSMNMVSLDRRNTAETAAPQLLDHLSVNMVALDRLSMDTVALEGRLAQLEKRTAALAESMPTPAAQAIGRDRTLYVIGLFGTGRRYINELILENIGERAKYFRDTIRLHPGPTPMIYSGHATVRHISRAQELPYVMNRISDAVQSGFANLIFIYRHPLDSLLTNWIWWRTYIRENRLISGISQVYPNPDDLCADLDRNFPDFQSFADGAPEFFAGMPGPRFLSFAEFVEETELHLQAATLALRLEDFMADPLREFSKIAAVLPADLDSSRLCLARPRTKPYGYLAVRDKVPRFQKFIDELSVETKREIANIGYDAGD